MRSNLPVTQKEYDYPTDATLMSTTDLQSHIRYCNGAFIAVSGYEQEELVGQPHNIVRHPDMPGEAFADMWATPRGGGRRTALVEESAAAAESLRQQAARLSDAIAVYTVR